MKQRIYEVGGVNSDKVKEVYLDGVRVEYVVKFRVGTSGWVDAYEHPHKTNANCNIKMLPRMRGKVEVIFHENT